MVNRELEGNTSPSETGSPDCVAHAQLSCASNYCPGRGDPMESRQSNGVMAVPPEKAKPSEISGVCRR
jgi:hypothetical protein